MKSEALLDKHVGMIVRVANKHSMDCSKWDKRILVGSSEDGRRFVTIPISTGLSGRASVRRIEYWMYGTVIEGDN